LQDTMVTNYGYSNGVATPRQAVLQAGTGVLVDSTGQPVVRCACGDPLTAPAAINLPAAQFQGARWDTFNPARTVVVKAAPAVDELVLVDATTGQSYTQPVAAGATDPATASAAATPSAPSSPTDSSAAPDAECAFQLQYPETGPAWVQADVNVVPGDPGEHSDGGTPEPLSTAPGSGFSCPEMIARWQTYEQWTGERRGQWQEVNFPDQTSCGVEFIPAAEEGTAADGAVGWCFVGNRPIAVWRGEVGQHLTSSGTEASQRPSTATTVPDTTTQTPATISTVTGAPAVGVPQVDLVTPSGNIECGNIGDRLDCVILQHDFPDGCDSSDRAYVTLELTGMAQFGPCIGDVFGRAQLTPTGYGTVVSLGQFTCDVEQTGVRCTNPEAHGFQLSRAAFSPF